MYSRVVRESTPAGNRRAEVHTSESSTSNRGSFNPDRSRDEHREKQIVSGDANRKVAREALRGSFYLVVPLPFVRAS